MENTRFGLLVFFFPLRHTNQRIEKHGNFLLISQKKGSFSRRISRNFAVLFSSRNCNVNKPTNTHHNIIYFITVPNLAPSLWRCFLFGELKLSFIFYRSGRKTNKKQKADQDSSNRRRERIAKEARDSRSEFDSLAWLPLIIFFHINF